MLLLNMKKLSTKYSDRLKIFTSVVVIGLGIMVFWAAILPTPDLSSFSNRKIEESTKIYDRSGKIVLFDFFEDKRRRVINGEDISIHIKNAIITAEDANFYTHSGIRPTAIVRAVFTNLFSLGFTQGGSTITQQLVKNSLLTSEKTISRKLKEWVLSIKIEKEYTKEEILAFYLNEIPYGGTIYGVSEATSFFFNKTPGEVTIAESVYLASLPKAPSYYSPFGANRDKLEQRKNNILKKMFDSDIITLDEYNEAVNEEVTFLSNKDSSIQAPHFVFFVRRQLEKLFPGKDINTLGLSVITTLDYELQKKAEEIVKRYAIENEEKFNAENAGAVVIEVETGDILAMVGSRDYLDEEIDGAFNVTLANRQPGSVFKPFAYAVAFDKGYTPETVLFDVETQFQDGCSPDDFGNEEEVESEIENEAEDACYSPENYDGVFRGPITMRDALAQSINLAAIKTLYLAGLNKTFNLAKNMGLGTLTDPSRYGLTLVLGGGEVRLLDMTNAYAVFARDGEFLEYKSIVNVINKDGKEVVLPKQKTRNSLNKQPARTINDILSDNVARAPAFGERSALYFPSHSVAAKTGTTNDYRDAWIVGYSPDVAVGSWAGNNDNSPMEKKVAGFIVAPMWNEITTEALKRYGDASSRFVPPQTILSENGKPVLYGSWKGGDLYHVDTISGGLATELTPLETIEERYLYDPHSILHWVDVKNPLGNPPSNPDSNPQYKLWEYGVQEWVKNNISKLVLNSEIPNFIDNVHTVRARPIINFIYPTNDSDIPEGNINLNLNILSRHKIENYSVYFNNSLIVSTSQSNGDIFMPYSQIRNLIRNGDNQITVSVKDGIKNTVGKTINVRFK